jgi:hypothetical protein
LRRFLNRPAWLVALMIMIPVSARADGTVLVGLTSVGALRPSFGFSFGYRPSAVGVEVEYVSTFPQNSPGGYSAGGIFGSVFVQPVTISNVQIFAVGGVGVWGEGFTGGKRTGVLNAGNVGGGVLVALAGPLKLRLDYRLFLLGQVSEAEVGAIAPSRKHPQRIAAGLHFTF